MMEPDSTSAHGESLRDILIDVSRLIWRLWSGRLPTGIDRVCLEYVAHYGPRADPVLQWKGRRMVLTGSTGRKLLRLLSGDRRGFRWRLIALLLQAPTGMRIGSPGHGRLYLNVGHTGLNDPGLGDWIARHGLRAVYLIHDLIPIETPEYCRPGEADRHVLRMTHALAGASGIIGNSQATLDALRAFASTRNLPVPPMIAAWLGGDTLPAMPAKAAADRPYFVVLGTIEGRKNHLMLLQIWKGLVARLGDAAPRLILIGQRGWEAEGAFAMLDRCSSLKDAVIERGRCDDADVAGLLAGARALLMPSFAEGFGMPVIEAMQLGTPVIVSDLPVFREIAGDLPLYLAPLDTVGWERAILDFCIDSPERARQVAAMPACRAPGWVDHFTVVDRWLEALPA